MRCDLSTCKMLTFQSVSIHTPTWGVTMDYDEYYDDNNGFNPHTYMRCDWIGRSFPSATRVSIHTPTWGVTLRPVAPERVRLFQSTHLHEVWLPRSRCCPSECRFQSTHLHEVWLTILTHLSRLLKFQSTHLHEVWLLKQSQLIYTRMFQSTHLHEVWHWRPMWKTPT